MRPVRHALALTVLWPSAALAEACATARPDWDGAPVTAVDEALFLAGTVPVLILIAATAVALRFRSQWGGLAVVVLWTVLISILSMFDPGGLQSAARAEGCVGSPALFIGAVAAICVATILYTAPLKQRPD